MSKITANGVNSVLNGGWTQCYVGTMAQAIGSNAQNVLSACSGDYMNSSPMSMCLHTLDSVGGYRINDIVDLNDSTAYQKIFFQASAAQVPEPATLALAGLALAGLALVGVAVSRRRKSA